MSIFNQNSVSVTINDPSKSDTDSVLVPLSTVDFNGDGLDDLIVGGIPAADVSTPGVYFLQSNGSGGFTDVTSSALSEDIFLNNPTLKTGDFTGDGNLDIAFFAWGDYNDLGTFDGEIPLLLVGNGSGQFTVTDIQSSTLHAKDFSAGDIDNDGDLDLFVESGGGEGDLNVLPHFEINNGSGSFTVDTSRLPEDLFIANPTLNDPETGEYAYRYGDNHLADLNNDGYLDVVAGTLRKNYGTFDLTPTRSFVIFNDGTGNFLESDAYELPLAAYEDGYSPVDEIVSLDLNGDCLLDLVFASSNGNFGSDGRYMQALINNGDGTFSDESGSRFGDQSLVSADDNYSSSVDVMEVVDFNGDGHLDIMTSSFGGSGSTRPLVYLNNGEGAFSPLTVSNYGASDTQGMVGDFNGDGNMDIAEVENIGDSSIVNIFTSMATGTVDINRVNTAASFCGDVGNDTYSGADQGDSIYGKGGADLLTGQGGNDYINGNDGNDNVTGDSGSDTVRGGQGNDYIDGGDDDDTVLGDIGSDTLRGSDGNDYMNGGRYASYAGDDVDVLYGGSGNDFLQGNLDADQLFGEGGNDTLRGGQDNDVLYGGDDDDHLYGDGGSDTINGGGGTDLVFMQGGSGDYSVSTDGGTTTLTHTDGSVDTLSEVEEVVYLDGGGFFI